MTAARQARVPVFQPFARVPRSSRLPTVAIVTVPVCDSFVQMVKNFAGAVGKVRADADWGKLRKALANPAQGEIGRAPIL